MSLINFADTNNSVKMIKLRESLCSISFLQNELETSLKFTFLFFHPMLPGPGTYSIPNMTSDLIRKAQ